MKTKQMEKTVKNLIGLFVNIARAYEVAKLGNFSIRIVFDKEYLQGVKDYKEVVNFFSDVKFAADGDIIVQMYKPDYSTKVKAYETLEDINKRILKAQEREFTPYEFKNEDCEKLLKTATNRLDFNLTDIEKIRKIAGIIAKLAGVNYVEAQHIAEAIQYRAFLPEDGYIDPLQSTLNFGDGITISLTDKAQSDIEQAIKYLQSLL